MIKFNKKTKLKHVQDRLDILEQNIKTLNNNILNLEICFNIHKQDSNIYGQERLTNIQKILIVKLINYVKFPHKIIYNYLWIYKINLL